MKRYAFIAIDSGPRAVLQPIAKVMLGSQLSPAGDAYPDTMHYWISAFKGQSPDIVFVGTSDSTHGVRVESAVRQAAERLRVPTVVVEDFPGNYRALPETIDTLLVADGVFSLRLAETRAAGRFAHGIALPGLRYDFLRGKPSIEAVPVSQRILWAGQPETDRSLETLARLEKIVEDLGLHLLFRAHPRDVGYADGAYMQFFSRLGNQLTDMTSSTWKECLARSPCLVVTQYSSVAVEMSFHGIPAVYVLYDDIGGRNLFEKKGYAAPALCDSGASWVIRRKGEEAGVFGIALDPGQRASALREFSRFMRSDQLQATILQDCLYNHGLI